MIDASGSIPILNVWSVSLVYKAIPLFGVNDLNLKVSCPSIVTLSLKNVTPSRSNGFDEDSSVYKKTATKAKNKEGFNLCNGRNNSTKYIDLVNKTKSRFILTNHKMTGNWNQSLDFALVQQIFPQIEDLSIAQLEIIGAFSTGKIATFFSKFDNVEKERDVTTFSDILKKKLNIT